MYDIFTYIWLVFYGFHVAKYTIPMDPYGKGKPCRNQYVSCNNSVDDESI